MKLCSRALQTLILYCIENASTHAAAHITPENLNLRTHPQLNCATLVALSKPRTFRNKLNESMSFVLCLVC
ncbi:hypothetical protein HMPREF3208_00722 [Gardnerella vaginalis]|uniref:Uncharacterized protein n=1 Tax=Gardnerella vaginalis TaxID=2702 RepID=A0A133NXB2_GARVA|nr:hypothetical protein HMPREF3208_00722 [Gardnerella vaginalis]